MTKIKLTREQVEAILTSGFDLDVAVVCIAMRWNRNTHSLGRTGGVRTLAVRVAINLFYAELSKKYGKTLMERKEVTNALYNQDTPFYNLLG